MTYDAVLFDMEGVLLKGSETASWIYRTAAGKAIDDLGLQATHHDMAALEDFHYTQKMQSTCERIGVSAEEFWERREAHAAELENQQLRDGEREPFADVRVLEELVPSFTLGVVSNNRQATVDQMTSVYGLDYMNVAIGRDHSLKGYYDRKPEPTMIAAALRDINAKSALYVGDSPKDIVAADRAGIDSAFVRRSHNADTELEHPPIMEVGGLVELADRIDDN